MAKKNDLKSILVSVCREKKVSNTPYNIIYIRAPNIHPKPIYIYIFEVVFRFL